MFSVTGRHPHRCLAFPFSLAVIDHSIRFAWVAFKFEDIVRTNQKQVNFIYWYFFFVLTVKWLWTIWNEGALNWFHWSCKPSSYTNTVFKMWASTPAAQSLTKKATCGVSPSFEINGRWDNRQQKVSWLRRWRCNDAIITFSGVEKHLIGAGRYQGK